VSKTGKSALTENEGVSISEITHNTAIKSFKKKRKLEVDIKTLVARILKKDITALSQAITLIESKNTKHQNLATPLLKNCLPHVNNAIRIGITGVPGVGKSTFIEAFGTYLTTLGKRVAVLAIDPSSSISKGSILGDKTRMANLVKNENAFIRPSASGDALGGVARKTRESVILCEAAGFNVILIETVGVGQSETTVHSMVDFFLLLKLAGAGDDLQGIKRGIIEMADAIAINKADGDNLKPAKLAQEAFKRALQLYPESASGWQPKVTLCSAKDNKGIDDIWNVILSYMEMTKANQFFDRKRQEQNKFWLIQTIEDQLKSDFFDTPKVKKALAKQLQLIENNQTTPFASADYILKLNH